MDMDYIKIIVTILVAVIGWLIAHHFTSKRDVANKQRELSVQHLVNAYRVLTNDVSHREPNDERRKKLENILSDIQLFGSEQQIKLAQQLAIDVAEGKVFELDPLINCLRNDLRKHLGLSSVTGNIKWLRFNEA